MRATVTSRGLAGCDLIPLSAQTEYDFWDQMNRTHFLGGLAQPNLFWGAPSKPVLLGRGFFANDGEYG